MTNEEDFSIKGLIFNIYSCNRPTIIISKSAMIIVSCEYACLNITMAPSYMYIRTYDTYPYPETTETGSEGLFTND